MNELKVLEMGIVPVYTTDTGEKVVDGRELWTAIQSKQRFTDWVKDRLSDCEAVENTDFLVFHKNMKNLSGGRPTQEYIIKLPIAKEMAMLERNDIGKQVRKYFIAVEEKYKQQAIDMSRLSPEMQALGQLWENLARTHIRQQEMQKQLETVAEKTDTVVKALETVKDTIIQRDDDWRKAINKMFNAAVEASDTKNYQALRNETYAILEERAHCILSRRLRNLQDRMTEQGATKTAVKNTTRMDVIENDPRLKEIYTSIVKELSVKFLSIA